MHKGGVLERKAGEYRREHESELVCKLQSLCTTSHKCIYEHVSCARLVLGGPLLIDIVYVLGNVIVCTQVLPPVGTLGTHLTCLKLQVTSWRQDVHSCVPDVIMGVKGGGGRGAPPLGDGTEAYVFS